MHCAPFHRYVGIDPLKANPGWQLNLEQDSGARSSLDNELAVEARVLFGQFQLPGATGAIFRLPLRPKEAVADGLGPEHTTASAMELLVKWAESLSDSRTLLFLAAVKVVTIRRWDVGASEPTEIARVGKEYIAGGPCPRLPGIPEKASGGFAQLGTYLRDLSQEDRRTLAKLHTAQIAITVSRPDAAIAEKTAWLVVQRFDATDHKLLELMEDCGALPTVGVAIRLPDPANTAAIGSAVTLPPAGAVFCFLPVGDLKTGLPVHVNGSFQVTKNRRSLWLKSGNDKASEMDGAHAVWAEWNATLLCSTLPSLWVKVLADMTDKMVLLEPGPIAAFLDGLPNLDNVDKVDRAWRACAEGLYRRLARAQVLPHLRGAKSWLAPENAEIVELPTEAFRLQAVELMELYTTHAPEGKVVQLPDHVKDACLKHSSLGTTSVSSLLRKLILCVPPSKLSRGLLALAECFRMSNDADPKSWKATVAIAWVSLQDQPRFVTPSDAFAPQLEHLARFSALSVVGTATANLTCDGTNSGAVLDTMLMWGLKTHLTWRDVLVEARRVESNGNVAEAEVLLECFEKYSCTIVPWCTPGRQQALEELSSIKIVPSVGPRQHGYDEPPVQLRAATDVLSPSDKVVVWAVIPTATKVNTTLLFRKLAAEDLAQQLIMLSKCDAECSVIEEPIREAAFKLFFDFRNFKKERKLALDKLRDVEWVPSLKDSEDIHSIRLCRPSHVALKWVFNLEPVFGKLNENWLHYWRTMVRDRTLFMEAIQEAGIDSRFSVSVLNDELAKMNEEEKELPEPLFKRAVNLVLELAERHKAEETKQSIQQKASQPSLVPTASRRLMLASNVFINDATWTSSEQDVQLLHDAVSHAVGRLLGCKSARKELARKCEVEVGLASNFGQHEQLADRIQNVLEKYDGRFDVLTEHWQNSDDAGAETLCFMIDETAYPTEKVVPGFKNLQGSALVLASSQFMSADDIGRIQEVGRSRKKNKFAQTGRFGIGFLCTYEVTDCPMLYANNFLHVFDPFQVAVAEGNETGKKYDAGMLKTILPDTLVPFEQLTAFPTIFRLPLRQSSCRLHTKLVNSKMATDMLKEFAAQAPKLLLFSKSVRCVRFQIKRSTGIELIAELECPVSTPRLDAKIANNTDRGEGAAGDLMRSLPKTLTDVKALLFSPRRAISFVSMERRDPHSSVSQRWLVAHALETDAAQLANLEKLAADQVALLPHGAAAVFLDPNVGSYDGQVCCYQPLEAMGLDAPVLLHGCFSLADDRKNIPIAEHSRSPTSHQWNRQLIEGALASSLAMVIEECCKEVDTGHMLLKEWFKLIGLAGTSSKRTFPLRERLCTELLRRLLPKKVFPVCPRGFVIGSPGTHKDIKWLNGTEDKPVLRIEHSLLSDSLQELLVVAGMPLVYLPQSLSNSFSVHGGPVDLSPKCLSDFLREAAPKVSKVDGLTTEASILELVKFIVPQSGKDECDLSQLQALPLLLLGENSGAVGTFGNTPCFWNNNQLLPKSPNLFIREELRKIFSTRGSLQSVQDQAEKLGILPFNSQSLLRYFDEVHAEEHFKDREWQRRAYAMINQDCNGDPQWDFVSAFENWKLVKVTTHCGDEDWVPLRDLPTVFSLHETDSIWRTDIEHVLSSCSVNTLHSDHVSDPNQLKLLIESSDQRPGVGFGDTDLLTILASSSSVQLRSVLDATATMSLLQYFSSTYFGPKKKLSEDQKRLLRGLPLFLRADKQGSYTTLDDEAVSYVAVHNGSLAMTRLDVLQHVCFLAVPTVQTMPVYEMLGVKVLEPHQFVLSFVVPALQRAAERTDQAKLNALLDELSAIIDKSLGSDITEIVEEAKKQRFVESRNGCLCTPAALTRPKHPLLVAFPNETRDWTPETRFDSRINLLIHLGLRRDATIEIIEACAKAPDFLPSSLGLNEPTNTTQLRSFRLVEEICCRLSEWYAAAAHQDFAARDLHKRLMDVTRLPVVLAVGGTLQQTMELKLLRGSRSRKVSLTLAPLRDLLLNPAGLIPLAGSVVRIIAHDDARPDRMLHSSQLVNITRHYSKELKSDFGCFSSDDDVPTDCLLQQLDCTSDIVAKNEAKLDVPVVNNHFLRLQTTLEARLTKGDDLPSPFGGCSRPCQPAFDKLNNRQCIPLVGHADAAGLLSASMASIRIVCPRQTFIRLPDAAREVPGLPLYEHSELRSRFPKLSSALGIRESPTSKDWAECTCVVGLRTGGKLALPNDIKAVEVAVKQALAATDDSSQHDKVMDFWLPGPEGQLKKADKLFWVDRHVLRDRCRGLSFLDSNVLKLQVHQFDKLCSVSNLTRLSDVVREDLSGDVVETVATDSAACLIGLMKSTEFIDGVAAIVTCAPSSAHRVRSRVEDVLQGLKVFCTTKLETVIHSDCGGLEGIDVSSPQILFVDKNAALWIRQDQLDVATNSDTLVGRLGGTILPEILQSAGTVSRTDILVSMLKCWSAGPKAILDVLRAGDIDVGAFQTRACNQPGDDVPDSLRWALQQSVRLHFQYNEIVAVRLDATGERDVRYIFAAVTKAQHQANPGAAPSLLSRRYMLNEGGPTPEPRSHSEIYKITRSEPIRENADAAGALDIVVGVEDVETALVSPDELDGSKWEELVFLLRQMEVLEPAEYKLCIHRLFKQWHPDKCDHPRAAKYFIIIRRHGDCYNGKKDFAWLNAEDPEDALPPAEMQPPQHSWFAEFEAEMLSDEVQQQRMTAARHTWKGASHSEPAKDKRMLDQGESHRYV